MSRFFAAKTVPLQRIASVKPTLTEPSDELRACIRKHKIKSLYGLLGHDWRRATRRLIDRYTRQVTR